MTSDERQEEELQVLEAIYGEGAVVDLRKDDAWKIPRPPEFLLIVTPNHDSKGCIAASGPDSSITIRVKFSNDYPSTVPALLKVDKDASNTQLTADDVSALEAEMSKLAASQVGEVMMLDIAQKVGSWLAWKAKGRGPRFGSFYEEMEAGKEKKERQKREELEMASKVSEKELEAIRAEVKRKEEALEEERIREKNMKMNMREEEVPVALGKSPQEAGSWRRRGGMRLRQSASECSSTDGYESGGGGNSMNNRPPEASFCQEEVRVNIRGEQIRFDKLALLGRNVLGGSVYLGNLDGKVWAVAEWPFKVWRGGGGGRQSKKGAEGSSEDVHEAGELLRQFGSIEQELRSIHKLDRHPNVVRYQGITYQQKHGRINLYVLEEYVRGSNLSFHLSENIAVETDLLRHYAAGVLEALEFMHARNFVHRDLRDTSVFVESSGCVRVTDFSIDKRVRELWTRPPSSSSSAPEDKFPVAIGRGGKKADVYRLGLLTLSLALGEIVQEPVTIPSKMFPPEFQDFLRRCLDKDERERWSSRDLLEHKGGRGI